MAINATELTIWGIPPYLFFSGIGILVAFVIFEVLLLHYRLDIARSNRTVVLSAPALAVGAKLFGIISTTVEALRRGVPLSWDVFTKSGIVFYGGLIFFLICFLLLNRKNPPRERELLNNCLAVCIPLFHAFGRVGCFTAGCCYGTVTSLSVGVTYTTWVEGVPMTAVRFPVQLMEASANLILFGVLLFLLLRNKGRGNLLRLYILLYAGIRFVDEFFRGDIDKTLLHGFSAAQAISVALMILVFIHMIQERKRGYVERE